MDPIESAGEIVRGVLGEQPIDDGTLRARPPAARVLGTLLHARRDNLQKESCVYRCLEHPDGMTLKTREGEPFLVPHGIQTPSAEVYSLRRETDSIRNRSALPGALDARDGFWYTRRVLYKATVAAIRHNPAIQAFYERQRAAGTLPKVALVACVRKLRTILNAMVRTRQPGNTALHRT